MAPIESYPFAPMQTPDSKAGRQMYPVVGKAVGLNIDATYDIVVRDNRYRMHNTLLPDDVKQRVAAGDVDWDGFRLTFL